MVRARVCEGHLPEAAFLWEPLERLEGSGETEPAAGPARAAGMLPVLVRRIVERPETPPAGLQIAEGADQPIRGADHEPTVRRFGPYVISGGWWVRPVHREYYFVEVRRGDVLWVYYDRQRRRWLLQGAVE